ncbi:MAG TPA: VIT1/CCC1 transporter family protein, partial [Chlamydiales bacterium]|nr:VIT1/CCC1 transporter family protein [Chlamydiales bacterium]
IILSLSLLYPIAFIFFSKSPYFLSGSIIFFSLYVLIATGKNIYNGWNRLLNLHRIISEEKWEIENKRDVERKELEKIYEAKGFSGKLLQDVVDTLMAQDDRLLQVMLEEELDLKLGIFEHPIKQGLYTLIAGIFTLTIYSLLSLIPHLYPIFIGQFFFISSIAIIRNHFEKNALMQSLIWLLAFAFFINISTYFLSTGFFF